MKTMTSPQTNKIIRFILLVFTCWFILHSFFVAVIGLKDNGQSADLGLILGSKVNEDGSLSESLEQRLKCALNLYNKKRIKYILVSGGLGKEGFYEGTKMKDFLIENGIPSKIIFVDNKGINTLASVKNTLALQKKLKFKSIMIISQYFHLMRAKMLFKKYGFHNISTSSPKYFEIRDFYSLPREFIAYYYYYFLFKVKY